MGRSLKIKVQADRLPDVGGKAQIALRVSAVIEGDGALPAPSPVDEILPWKWRLADGTGSWNPHDPGAWSFWQIDDVNGQPVVSPLTGTAVAVAGSPAGFDKPPSGPGTDRFRDRLAAEIDLILATKGGEGALCMPDEGAELTGRTVFGLVESLTGLPHPVGVATKVLTAFTIDPKPAETTTFIAVPKFAPAGGGVYDFTGKPSAKSTATPDAPVYTVKLPRSAGAPKFDEAATDMIPTLAWSVYKSTTDPNQLIDMTRMLVRNPGTLGGGGNGTGMTDNDWAATLSRCIVEALDPWARVLAVLDRTVVDRLEKVGSPLREAILADVAGVGSVRPERRFLKALDAIAWWVVGDRMAATPQSLPVAVSLIEGLGAGGKVRFLRILRPRTRVSGGYLDKEPIFPDDFFPYDTIADPLDMNPPDAKGMVLGVSRPIEWKRG